MGEEKDSGQINYVKAALGWQYNWIALAGAGAFALVSGSGLPLLLAAGLELIYLSIIPQNGRFQRLVRSWQYAEEKRKRDMSLSALFHEMPPELRTRYAQLDATVRAIRENYKRLSSTSQMFVEQMEAKLEGLAQSYLRLLNAAHHHREHLRTTNPEGIRREARELEKGLDKQAPKVQEINRKRIEILDKRVEKYEKVRENCQVIDAQCAAVEDVLQLIRDQSVTMRDPQQLSDHLDSLVRDVEQTEETVREVESIFELSPLAEGGFDAPPTSRNRIRS
jgi:hypothetical protein